MRTFALMRRALAPLAVVAGLATLVPAPVAAKDIRFEIRVCNNSGTEVRVAASYIPPGSNKWRNEGWFAVRNGRCATLGDSGNAYFYLYAEEKGNSSRHWGGDHQLCVEHPGPYLFWTGRTNNCTPAQTLAGFRTFEKRDSGSYTWNLNP